jgi:hypothetical protein
MKTFFLTMAKNIGQAVFTVVFISSAVFVYAAWNTPVKDGDTLTSTLWNELVAKVADLDSKKADKTQIPNMAGYATTTQLNTALASKANNTGWTNVSLTSASDFNVNCMYRIKLQNCTTLNSGHYGTDPWFYFSGVDTNILIYNAHSGVVVHINSDSKDRYRCNTVAGCGNCSVKSMQQRCL